MKLQEKIDFLKLQEYEPIFIGINLYENEIETKVYFISEAFGFQIKQIVTSTKAIMKKYNLNMYFYLNALPRKKV